MIKCARCGQETPLENMVKNRNKPSGCGSYCVPCGNIKSQEYRATHPQPKVTKESKARWRRNNPKKSRAYHIKSALKKWYGLTPEEYADALKAQDGKCAICGGRNEGWRQLCVDHNHETNEIRGLLCSNCNSGLGFFGDSVHRLMCAIDYLAKHNLVKKKVS